MKPTIEEMRRMVTALELSDEQFEYFKPVMLAALDVAEACVDWVDNGEECHTCGQNADDAIGMHDDECPVGAFLATIAPSKPEGT